MAGIGFRFREIVTEGSYLSVIKGYLFSAVFAAGPWIMTMAVIAVLNTLAPPELSGETLVIFRASLTYIYGMSLVVVGTFQYPITRYIADRIYEKDRGEILSTFVGSMFLFSFLSFAMSVIFLSGNTGDFAYKILFTLIFVTISLIWNGMIFLSAIRDYRFIVFVFLSGSIVSIALSYVLKNYFGLNGYMLGYFLGQLYILSGHISEIVREFYNDKGATYYYLNYVRKYGTLLFAGLAYNLAIWIDKLIIWNSALGECYLGNLRICGMYDVSIFVAFLSIIPALAYFMVRIETGFYDLYRNYFTRIMNKNPLSKLEECRDRIVYMVDSSVLELFKIQGAITLVCFIYSEQIMANFAARFGAAYIFKFAIVGVFFHILFLFMTIFMMYFEFYTMLLITTTYFLVSNGVLTFIGMALGRNLAWGYLVSSATSFFISYIFFRIHLRRLLYYTFVGQPVSPVTGEKAVFDSFKFLEASGRRGIAKHEKFEGIDFNELEK